MTLTDQRGNELPPDVQRRILEQADRDHDGHLNYAEFERLVCYSHSEAYIKGHLSSVVPYKQTVIKLIVICAPYFGSGAPVKRS